jgi:hypothetical protein
VGRRREGVGFSAQWVPPASFGGGAGVGGATTLAPPLLARWLPEDPEDLDESCTSAGLDLWLVGFEMCCKCEIQRTSGFQDLADVK